MCHIIIGLLVCKHFVVKLLVALALSVTPLGASVIYKQTIRIHSTRTIFSWHTIELSNTTLHHIVFLMEGKILILKSLVLYGMSQNLYTAKNYFSCHAIELQISIHIFMPYTCVDCISSNF